MNAVSFGWLNRLPLALLLLTSFFLSQASAVGALDEAVVGLELTFSYEHPLLRLHRLSFETEESIDQAYDVYASIARSMSRACKNLDCKVQQDGLSVMVTFNDGFYIHFASDPKVVEVTTRKMSYSEFLRRAPLLQSMVFDELDKLQLRPMQSLGGGHINLDIWTHFKGNLHGVVDFLETLVLEDAVFAHAFRKPSMKSARPASALTEDQYADLRQIFQSTRTYANSNAPDSYEKGIEFLATEMRSRFDSHRPGAIPFFFTIRWDDERKDYRLEIRSPKPQASIREARDLITLFHLQIRNLKDHPPARTGLPLTRPKAPAGPEEIAERFLKHVTQLGGSPSDFFSVLRKDVQPWAHSLHCAKYLDFITAQ